MDLFEKHPRPWRVSPDYPAPGSSPDNEVVLDANGDCVLGSSEWFWAEDGVVAALVNHINKGEGS